MVSGFNLPDFLPTHKICEPLAKAIIAVTSTPIFVAGSKSSKTPKEKFLEGFFLFRFVSALFPLYPVLIPMNRFGSHVAILGNIKRSNAAAPSASRKGSTPL